MVAVATPTEVLRSPFWLHDAGASIRAVDGLRIVGVVDTLNERPATITELVSTLDLARRPLELALDIASRMEVVTCMPDGRWTVDPVAIRMILSADAVVAALRGGVPETDASDVGDAEIAYAEVVPRLGRISGAIAHEIVPTLRLPGQTVLELAAGASPWGRALCTDDPTTTVTAVDLPNVVRHTERAVVQDGFEDRYEFVESDVFALETARASDLVLLAGFCRLLGEAQNRGLFHRAARWCSAGGRIAVVDAVNTPEAQAAGLAGYELGLLTRTARGRCWSFDHYARWLADAGFSQIRLESTSRPEISLVIARRTAE